jgi:hypothetical protein
MAVTVISGIPPKSKPPTPKPKKAARKPQLQVRLSDDDIRHLDECVRAAQTNRPELVRRWIRLAHRDLLRWRETTGEIAKPGNNGHEVSEEVT